MKPTQTSQPFIYEQEGTRSLHFGSGVEVQSQMRIDAPEHLVLGYTRIMIGFLLFVDCPEHIGMIGLGGGSIQKHCYRHLPNTRITVAEINLEVIALRDKFSIPHDNHRFAVFHEDGAAFVKRHPGQFDVLVIDGFDAHGQPPQLCSREFYDDCYAALDKNGVMVVNLCESLPSTSIWRLQQSFGEHIVVVDADDSENSVVFAGKGNVWSKSDEQLRQTQVHIERCQSVSLTRMVRELLRERKSLCSLYPSERSRELSYQS